MSEISWAQQHKLRKAYGNGIVPEVAMNIMQAIKSAQDGPDKPNRRT